VVEATGGGHFQIYEEDWRAIREGFGIKTAYINDSGNGHQYIVGYLDGTNVPLARLITQAKRRERVTYHDGNGLNLRRDNLTVEKGYSKRAAPTASEEKVAA
jgi:hypothetical protein